MLIWTRCGWELHKESCICTESNCQIFFCWCLKLWQLHTLWFSTEKRNPKRIPCMLMWKHCNKHEVLLQNISWNLLLFCFFTLRLIIPSLFDVFPRLRVSCEQQKPSASFRASRPSRVKPLHCCSTLVFFWTRASSTSLSLWSCAGLSCNRAASNYWRNGWKRTRYNWRIKEMRQICRYTFILFILQWPV